MEVNFSQAEQIKEDVIQVAGWVYPLEVKYGIMHYSWEIYLLWQVLGTEHIFRVPLKMVTAQHGSKYTEHFVLTLKRFREDLLEWNSLGLPEEWMRSYWKQFSELIR